MTHAVLPEFRDRARALASVIVRSYNYARFVGQAIDSALAQTYAPLEVIVVDDGSTDGSRDVIASYGSRIKPVLKANGGMASSMEAGFAASRGEIIFILDSDDALLPTAIAAAVELFRDPRVVKVHWPLREIDSKGEATGRVLPRVQLQEGDLAPIMIATGPMSGDGPPMSGNAWTRGFLECVLPMPEPRIGYHADSYLSTLAALSGLVGRVSEPQGLYRTHGDNNYAAMPLTDRLARNLRMYHYRCRLQSRFLRSSGQHIHPSSWKTNNPYYSQLTRRLAVFQQIAAVIPAGETFILVDEGASGPGRISADRECVRFPSSTDEPRGRPANDGAALEELERMRQDGAGFVVFIKPALWWLNAYHGLREHLELHYSCELVTEYSVCFNLRV